MSLAQKYSSQNVFIPTVKQPLAMGIGICPFFELSLDTQIWRLIKDDFFYSKGWIQLNHQLVLKFPHFFLPACWQKQREFQNWLMMKLVPSFKLKTNYLYNIHVRELCHIFKEYWTGIKLFFKGCSANSASKAKSSLPASQSVCSQQPHQVLIMKAASKRPLISRHLLQVTNNRSHLCSRLVMNYYCSFNSVNNQSFVMHFLL